MAKKPTLQYECSECGWTTSKWIGQCRQCSAWGTARKTPVVATDQVCGFPASDAEVGGRAYFTGFSRCGWVHAQLASRSSTASLAAALFPAQSYSLPRTWGW